MEQRNNLVLQGTETFSRGALDNVALESGALVLDSSAGRYLPYGSYTTPEFAMPPFCNLNVSWNASAPHNTMVEVRCRVYAGNSWTGWMSFGKWAPDSQGGQFPRVHPTLCRQPGYPCLYRPAPPSPQARGLSA